MPIAIIGSPRSGTSAIARAMNISGLYLGGGSLNGSDASSPLGYWEHEGFIDINERLQSVIWEGTTWPRLFPQGWREQPEIQPIIRDAAALIDRDFTGREPWGWKDPRTTLLLPFWQSVIPDIRYVICFRNPLDVAASVNFRDGVPEETVVIMWYYYTVMALNYTRPEERILVHYSDLLENYRAALAPVISFAGLPALERDSEQDRQIAQFVRGDLRHHSHTLEDLRNSPHAPPYVCELFEALLERPNEVSRLGAPLSPASRLALTQACVEATRYKTFETELRASSTYRMAMFLRGAAERIPGITALLRSAFRRPERLPDTVPVSKAPGVTVKKRGAEADGRFVANNR